MSKESLKALYQDTGPLIYGLFLGTISNVTGGFIAARFGKFAPYKNAAVIGVIGIILGVLLWSKYPLWFNVLCLITTIPSTLLGAYFIARRKA